MTAAGLAERGHKVDIVLSDSICAYPQLIPETARVIVCPRRPLSRTLARNNLPPSTVWSSSSISQGRLIRGMFGQFMHCPRAVSFALRRRRVQRLAGRLARYLECERPDVVFSSLALSELAMHVAARLVSPPPVVVPVIVCVQPGNEAWRLELWRRSEWIVAISNGVAEWARSCIGPGENNIDVIHNPTGTPANLEHLAKQAADHPWFGDGGPPIVLGAGRLMPQKDFRTLIDAFHRVRSEHASRLIILGEGPMRGELEDHVRRRGLEDYVSMPGFVENIFAFMSRATLFTLSSAHEGFGNVLVEAMACGCPAVSTDCPAGPREILEDPELLSPVGDPDALACTMLRQLSKPADKTLWRAKASRFSLERHLDRYERLLDRLLASRT